MEKNKKIRKKKNKKKDKMREFLLSCPYNFCDRNCERCDEYKENCAIFQEENQFKLRCVMENKDPNDPKIVFEHIANIFSKTADLLNMDMQKMGIEISDHDVANFENIWKDKEREVEKHPLYKMCRNISYELEDFAFSFQSTSSEYLHVSLIEGELNEIFFYGNLIFIKIIRSLHAKIEEEDEEDKNEKFFFSDVMISASLSYFSLYVVEKSLENIFLMIEIDQIIWRSKLGLLLQIIAKTKKLFLKTFPDIEENKNKIIFHGKL